ncbi:radical SAM protein [Candidatus Latescibacterota bacterium]
MDWGWFDRKKDRIVYESRSWNGKYDYIAFSIPYELLYFDVIRCLLLLKLEPERSKRNQKEPIVIAGGAAPTINNEVAGAIADIVYIGEAEHYLADAIRQSVSDRKEGAAQQLTPMSGMKIPDEKSAAPRFICPVHTINSSFLPGFDDPIHCAFKDAGLVEVGRGCSRGCRFCAAGQIYLPIRHRSAEAILRDVDSYSGRAKRIGLVGASISDYRNLKEVLSGIIDRGFSLTTSSFRADMLDDELASLLWKGGMKTVTIAPEGGSERIRKIMNKRLTEDEILRSVQACSRAGIKNLRLYYMVGLPWEKENDIDAIIDLTGKITGIFNTSGGRITVSVNPFIPKPQTPFQWCGMAEPSYIKAVYKKLGYEFRRMPGTALKTLSVRVALKEAVISLGDKAVGRAIITNIRDKVPWKKALSLGGVNVDKLVHTTKAPGEIFPWDAITGEKTKKALLASFEKARSAAQNSL